MTISDIVQQFMTKADGAVGRMAAQIIISKMMEYGLDYREILKKTREPDI